MSVLLPGRAAKKVNWERDGCRTENKCETTAELHHTNVQSLFISIELSIFCTSGDITRKQNKTGIKSVWKSLALVFK